MRTNPRETAEHQACKDMGICILDRSTNCKSKQPENHRAGRRQHGTHHVPSCLCTSVYLVLSTQKGPGYINLFEKERNPVTVFCSSNISQVSSTTFPKGSSFSLHTGRETCEWCHFQRGHRCDRREATSSWKKFLRAHPAQQCHPRHALLSGRDFWACGTRYQVRSSSGLEDRRKGRKGKGNLERNPVHVSFEAWVGDGLK